MVLITEDSKSSMKQNVTRKNNVTYKLHYKDCLLALVNTYMPITVQSYMGMVFLEIFLEVPNKSIQVKEKSIET